MAETLYADSQRYVARLAHAATIQQQVQTRVVVGNVLSGLLATVGDIATQKNQQKRREMKHLLCQKVVEAAVGLSGCDRARATFYRAQGVALDGRIAELEFVAAAGERGQFARRWFRRGDGNRGDAVLTLVEEGSYDFIPDVQQRADARHWGGKDYRTLACVSVQAGDTPYGMLAIDAPAPDDLHDQDCLATLRALARLLGAGLAL